MQDATVAQDSDGFSGTVTLSHRTSYYWCLGHVTISLPAKRLVDDTGAATYEH